MHTHTIHLEQDALLIRSACRVDATDYEREKDSESPIFLCNKADWDTGASVTVISKSR